MGYSIQFRKLWRFEKRKWLLVVLLVAFTHLICQLFVLPYGNALRSLFPGDELRMHDKGIFLSRFSSVKSVMLSNSIPVNASDSVDAKLLVSVVKNADKYVLGGNIGHGDVEMEEKMNSENDLTLGKKDLENSFDDVEKRKEGDDFPSENVVNLGESSVVANNQDYKHFLVKVNGSRHSLSVDQIVEPSNGSSMNNVPGGDASVIQVTVGTVGTAIVSPSVVLPQEESSHSQSANTSADDHFSSEGSANLNESSASQKYRDINDVSDKLIETEHSIAPEQIVEPISDGVSAETTVEEDTSDFDDITSSVDLVSNSSIVIDSAVVNRSSTGAEIIVLPNNQSRLQFQSDISPPKNNSMTKKMRCEMPPKSVMSINEMNELLVRHRRSSRAMRPRWSSGHDQEILAAKMQIDNAPPAKNEIELYAPLFRNVSRFKRSYDLMERTLKVFIYKEGEKPIFHQPILKGLYASEGWFMKLMEGNRQFAVKDPKKAHLFYMPFSSRMLEYSLYVRNSHNRTNLRQYLKQYTERIAAKYRFWNRTGGADHFLVACHDWAPYETRHHMEHCIKALCNADVTTGFKIGRDISLPETYVRSARNPLRDLGGKSPSKRHILAFYAGNMHGYLRPLLLKHWKDKDPDMKILGPMPPGVASKMNYIQHMKSSKYCICPKGYEVNSPRVVEAIFYECVPVIISDNFVPPFFEVLDWGAFSVILAEKDIPNLKDVLLSIPEERYLAMQLAVRKAQKHFVWHAKPLKYDLFHMTLHSIWYNRVYQIKAR